MRDDTEEEPLTIDELARRTGMSSRNIRAHQSRGLLPPPAVRGRTGFYDDEHVARVELIKTLQADGFNLEAIRRLLERAGGSTAEVRELVGTARQGFADEEPEVIDADELERRWRLRDPGLLARALELDVLRARADGRFEVAPRLDRVARELAAVRIPADRVLDVLGELRRHADGVAQAYVRLFLDVVWEPFDRAGRPPEGLAEVQDALQRLQPLATESLLAVFESSMRAAIDGVARGLPEPQGAG